MLFSRELMMSGTEFKIDMDFKKKTENFLDDNSDLFPDSDDEDAA